MNPISNILKKQKLFIIDGALGTYLEEKGYDVKDKLWSAKFLTHNPQAIKDIHTDYLRAGANCIITASYQASYEGFMEKGFSEKKAKELIQYSITLAKEARDEFWESTDKYAKIKPLVAASIGPYGAYLADGSEYTGNYPIDEEKLYAFHKKRLATIIDTQPDILACETLPSLTEAKIIAKALSELPPTPAWISFSAKDSLSIRNGDSITKAAKWIETQAHICAIGINCTETEHISALIKTIKENSSKQIITYPNYSAYIPITKTWEKKKIPDNFGKLAYHWYQLGVSGVGGCCQTGPKEIAQISKWVSN